MIRVNDLGELNVCLALDGQIARRDSLSRPFLAELGLRDDLVPVAVTGDFFADALL